MFRSNEQLTVLYILVSVNGALHWMYSVQSYIKLFVLTCQYRQLLAIQFCSVLFTSKLISKISILRNGNLCVLTTYTITSQNEYSMYVIDVVLWTGLCTQILCQYVVIKRVLIEQNKKFILVNQAMTAQLIELPETQGEDLWVKS